MSVRSLHLNLRQRIVGAVSCYAGLVLLAAWEVRVAMIVIGFGIGVVFVDWKVTGSGAAATERTRHLGQPLWLTALVVSPVAANAVVLPLAIVGRNDDPHLGGVAGVIGLGAVWAGVAADRHGADPAHHGWWALGGGASAVTLFGLLAWALG